MKKVKVVTRLNDVVNRLNRTKKELNPDLAAEREAYDKEVRSQKKAEVVSQKRGEKAAREAAKKEEEARSYTNVMQVMYSTNIYR